MPKYPATRREITKKTKYISIKKTLGKKLWGWGYEVIQESYVIFNFFSECTNKNDNFDENDRFV